MATRGLSGESCRHQVARAARAGIRLFDTAQESSNEIEIGRGIRESGVDNDDVFIVTKVNLEDYRPYDLLWSARESLDNLRIKQLDLLLLHWPGKEEHLEPTLDALNEVAARGLARHIGVANFTADLFEKACALSDRHLVCNEVEYHPFINQDRVIAAARNQSSCVLSYAPMAQGAVNMCAEIESIARHHGVTPGQVSLAWLMKQESVGALPRIGPATDISGLLDVFDIELSDEDVDEISALRAENLRMCNPGHAPDWDTAE